MEKIHNETPEARLDTSLDPAIFLVNPSGIYHSISVLPEEMIKYELETQGIKANPRLNKARVQLSECLRQGTYKRDRQPVAMGAEEDIKTCAEYLRLWTDAFLSSPKSSEQVQQYILKMKFLGRRIEDLQVPRDKAGLLLNLSALKSQYRVLKDLLVIHGTEAPTVAIAEPRRISYATNAEEWSMNSTRVQHQTQNQSMNELGVLISQPSYNSTRAEVRKGNDTSLLDASLDFLNDSFAKEQASVRRATRPRISQGAQTMHTMRTFNDSPQSSGANFRCSHRNKVKIWEWDVKFFGEPNTISVVDFLRKVQETAKSRGASPIDLFDSGHDLFGGSALCWFRAGLDNKQFFTWEEVVAELMIDFEAYDYGDDLLEYIKGRLQLPTERIVVYFATMEDLFLKLGRPVDENLRVRLIRRNLRPEFIRGLGFNEVTTVDQLKGMCKVLEADFRRISRRDSTPSSKQPDSHMRSVRFPPRMFAMRDPGDDAESDYDRYERQEEIPNRFRSNSGGNRVSFHPDSKPYDNRRRFPSPRPQASEISFDRRMSELSLRDDPHLPVYNVPPPETAARSPAINSQSQYFAPARANDASQRQSVPNQFSNSGNLSQGHSNWTQNAPQMIKRPY